MIIACNTGTARDELGMRRRYIGSPLSTKMARPFGAASARLSTWWASYGVTN